MKEKWYITTGRESDETKQKATEIMLGVDGEVYENDGEWWWDDKNLRTDQRLFQKDSDGATLVAYTLGEMV